MRLRGGPGGVYGMSLSKLQGCLAQGDAARPDRTLAWNCPRELNLWSVIANPREDARPGVRQFIGGLRKRLMKPKTSTRRGTKSRNNVASESEAIAPREAGENPPKHRTVHFELNAPNAREVYLAGSFDAWRPTSLPLFRMDNGIWVKELVLEPGCYEYLFVVDGIWTPDPSAPSVPNPFGGWNSQITVN